MRLPLHCVIAATFVACGSQAEHGVGNDGGIEAGDNDAAATKNDALTALPGFESGSRLRARYYDLGGGAKQLIAWHDTMLDLDCTFETFEGICLPVDLATFGAGGQYFADAQCTEPVAEWATDCIRPTYALNVQSQACGSVATVRRLGQPISPSLVYSLRDGKCELPAKADDTSLFWMLGDTVPTSSFVNSTIETVDLGARIEARVRVMDDGAHQVMGAFDSARGDSVDGYVGVGSFPGMEGTWQPHANADLYRDPPGSHDMLFGDDACTEPVVEISECVQKGLAMEFVPLPCKEYDSTLRDLGPRVSSSRLFKIDDSGSCLPAPDDGRLHAAVGAPISKDQWAPASLVQVGAGRIKMQFLAERAHGKPIVLQPGGELVDDKIGPCSVGRGMDDMLRCARRDAATQISDWYGDPACTMPLFAQRPSMPICADATAPPGDVWLLPEWVSGTLPILCDGRTSNYHIGSPYLSNAIWGMDSQGSCTPVSLAGTTSNDLRLFSLENADSELPIVQEVLE